MTAPGRPAWLTTTTTVCAAIVVLFAVATPAVIALDDRIDRTRPMHHDRVEMLWLQYRSVLTTGQSVPVEVTAQESVEIADETFTPSPGVRVEVRADETTRPCVRASNEDGDVTDWACLDPDAPPADPDPEDPDLGIG
jgi:hypothetical protein